MILKTNTLYIVSTPIGNLDDLTFIINKDKYGLSFQGGVTEMDETSYNYLISKSK